MIFKKKMQPKLQIVAAACSNTGIGIGNLLPWRIPGDMAFFRKLTSRTSVPGSQNAVIMGRKTWDSIPDNLKPLKNRLNVVVSRTLRAPDVEKKLHISESFEESIEFVIADKTVDKIFIIGGSSIYDLALKSGYCYNIFLTKVLKEFQCDTFFPGFDEKVYIPIKYPGLDRSIHRENDIEYKFTCYHKIRNTIEDIKKKDFMYSVVDTEKDFIRYISPPDNKVALILSRLTWNSMKEEERYMENVEFIIVANKTELIQYSDLICAVVGSFDEAICMAGDFYDDGSIKRISIIRGTEDDLEN